MVIVLCITGLRSESERRRSQRCYNLESGAPGRHPPSRGGPGRGYESEESVAAALHYFIVLPSSRVEAEHAAMTSIEHLEQVSKYMDMLKSGRQLSAEETIQYYSLQAQVAADIKNRKAIPVASEVKDPKLTVFEQISTLVNSATFSNGDHRHAGLIWSAVAELLSFAAAEASNQGHMTMHRLLLHVVREASILTHDELNKAVAPGV